MTRRFFSLAAAALVLAAALPTLADVRLPALFTDHMVLQQGQKNRVWGWADAGEAVVVTIAGQRHTATADAKGKWLVTLDALPVGGPHTLAVTGKNKLAVEDVLVGEVWICSGQSNMAWSVLQSQNPQEEIAAARHPNIRMSQVRDA